MCELFECHCFLEDVRENSNSNAIVKLQNQLVSQILKRESIFEDVNQGIDKIKSAIHKKKVLIVLDDVDKKFQIDKLAGNHSWYEPGSRIIITTRNEEVLLALEMTCQNEGLHELYKCYRPKLMDDNPALQLFSKYAFMRDSPPKGYDDLAMKVVSSAGGLPLVLVTLGSLLFIEKDEVSWKDKLKKLQSIPPEEVLGRLRISYNALDNVQKQIFLDIACFFSGNDKTNPYYMWDDCKFYPGEGINALVRRSLITVGDDNRLWMHDRLRELGEQIICENYQDELEKWSRLGRSKDAWDVLKKHLEGTFTDVKLLHLDPFVHVEEFEGFDERSRRLAGQIFRKLTNLRYLSMYSIDLDGDFKNLLQNLRWLQWWNFSGKCVLTNLHLKNLVVLDISYSTITDDWGGWSQIKMSKKLKVLDLSHCNYLTRIPHLSAFPTLERLELKRCLLLCRLAGLEELESLKYLNASSCIALKSLPDLSKLTSLQTLYVKSCSTLIEIQGLDKLESLEILDTSYCKALERLPNLSNLQKLTRFYSSWCEMLVEIQGLDRLASLEHLDISGCKSLKSLPDLLNLKKLRNLVISSCDKLIDIQCLHGLESLEHLVMHKCKCIVNLRHFSNLTNLKKLDVSHCVKLTELRGLEELKFLKELRVAGCESLENLPNLPNTRIQKDYDHEVELL